MIQKMRLRFLEKSGQWIRRWYSTFPRWRGGAIWRAYLKRKIPAWAFWVFYAFCVAVSGFGDTVVFRNNETMAIEDFEIVTDHAIRLRIKGGDLIVPAHWVKKIILEHLTREPAPPPRGVKIPYQNLIVQYASRYGLDWRLVAALIEQESGFNPWAVSRRGAIGLMQLLPSTGRLFGARDLFDPVQNLRAGMSYLSYLIRRYDGDLEKVLAAYNAGPGVVDRFNGIPPYSETRWYVENILMRYDRWIQETESTREVHSTETGR